MASKQKRQPQLPKPAVAPTLRWSKAQLVALAEDLDLDLGDRLTKANILAAIEDSHAASTPTSISRGQRLYAALITGTSPEAVKVLAEESARITDRLDELDRIIAGKGVLNLMRFRLHESFDLDDDGPEDRRLTVTVKFDSVLGEARQQAGALRQILVALGVEKTTQAPPASGGTPLDEFTRKLAEREAARQARA